MKFNTYSYSHKIARADNQPWLLAVPVTTYGAFYLLLAYRYESSAIGQNLYFVYGISAQCVSHLEEAARPHDVTHSTVGVGDMSLKGIFDSSYLRDQYL